MLNRRGAPQLIADSLRDQILEGKLPLGAPLRENELSETYSVARNTMREGLRLLVHGGLATYKLQHGVAVRSVSALDAEHAFGLRMMIECAVADRAGTLTEQEIAELRACAKVGEDALQARKFHVAIIENMNFHRTLVSLLNNPRILAAFDGISGEITLMLTLFNAQSPNRWSGRNDHLLNLLRTGTPDEFRAEMKKFLLSARDETVAAIEAMADSEGSVKKAAKAFG